MTEFVGIRFKVTFHASDPNPLLQGVARIPSRIFHVRAVDKIEAFKMALMIENVYERPARRRDRTFEDAIIEALTGSEEE